MIGWLPETYEEAESMHWQKEGGVLPNQMAYTIYLWGANAGNMFKTGGGAGQAAVLAMKDSIYQGQMALLKTKGGVVVKDGEGKDTVARVGKQPFGYTVGVVTTPHGSKVKMLEA